jgi:hypothetical protein
VNRSSPCPPSIRSGETAQDGGKRASEIMGLSPVEGYI